MASHQFLSETELRLFDQVCEATHARSDDQKNLLRSFICDELTSEWSSLVTLMESSGPLSILSEDELRYMAAKLPSQADDAGGLFSQILPMLTQKTTDQNLIQAAIHDLIQYNSVHEKFLVKYKDHVRRSIMCLQHSPKTNDGVSVVEQKVNTLSLRKDQLKKEIRVLEGKISSRTDRFAGLSQPKNNTGNADVDTSSESAASTALDVLESSFSSYDHILSKLDALYGELGKDTMDEDAILHTARSHASQIVLSLATKCRTSLDTVFLEASHTYRKHAQSTPNIDRAINDERAAVYAEIQSLWDEMVPLAHMVVEKEYLKPILNKSEMGSERQSARDATIATYTSAMLRFMNERLRLLVDRIKILVYHHQTLLNALAHANNRPRSKPTGILGPTNTHSVSSKEDDKTKGPTLLQTIQRQMELYGPIPKEPGEKRNAPTPRMQVSKLDHYVMSRQRKGDDLARNMHNFFEAAAQAELTDAELGGQLLLESVITDSTAGCRPGGHVYDDQQVEDSVATMKSQAEEIETAFAKLREDGAGVPKSASEFVTHAYNKAAKQPPTKGSAGSTDLDGQERCAKLAALISKWDDSANFRH
ncbi:hypothetical protein F4819DRAFT_153849 [Hypoxylon fuscum]|nr:hypothetical protein F4819DRAFT_153849 [Hypoxylon fuscum]